MIPRFTASAAAFSSARAPLEIVLALVLRQGLVLTAIGIASGLAGLTGYLQGMLFGLTPLDPWTFAMVSVLFAVVAAITSWVPARRATKVDPLIALRYE